MAALVATMLAGGSVAAAAAGCESTQEQSARLARASTGAIATTRSTVGATNRDVRVIATTVLRDANGTAVVVALRNRGGAQADVPIGLTVRGAGARVVYRNDDGGLDRSLVAVPALAAGASHAWVDDQIAASAPPRAATARVGSARARVAGTLPRLTVDEVRVDHDSSGAVVHGRVRNDSAVRQTRLVVHLVAHRGARIVAAGRAVIDALGPRASARFAVYPIGDPRRAALTLWAPATTLAARR